MDQNAILADMILKFCWAMLQNRDEATSQDIVNDFQEFVRTLERL